jgi:mRNA interferase RelE/StbE
VRSAIDSLAENPRPHGTQKLGGADQYRIRIGDYRVIYEIEDAELHVLVVRVGRRDSVY